MSSSLAASYGAFFLQLWRACGDGPLSTAFFPLKKTGSLSLLHLSTASSAFSLMSSGFLLWFKEFLRDV